MAEPLYDSDGTPSKRVKTETNPTQDASLKKYLVVGFEGFSAVYRFSFYPLEHFFVPSYKTGSLKVKPARFISWCPSPRSIESIRYQYDGDDVTLAKKYQLGGQETNPCELMSFVENSGMLYAVAGLIPISCTDFPPPCQSNEFFSIPLSDDENNQAKIDDYSASLAQVVRKASMKAAKLFPLIVVIGRCIYVLSMSPYPGEPAFEFYNLDDETTGWTQLETPPFLNMTEYISPHSMSNRYSYLVLGDRKLFVSDGLCSSVFDVWKKSWGKCDLFSGDNFFRHMKHHIMEGVEPDFKPPDGCGPGFWFAHPPILWKDGIFLCIPRPVSVVAAFCIKANDSRACRVPIVFYPYFPKCAESIVHLGGDFIAVLVYEGVSEESYLTAFVYTLTFEGNDTMTVHARLIAERHIEGYGAGHFFAV